MSEENISLSDLLNLSIGTPERGAVNFSALHALLHAVLRQLNIREVKTRWTDTPPGNGLPAAPTQEEEEEPRVQRSSSPSSSSCSPAAEEQPGLRSRVRTCEEDVSKAFELIQELHSHRDILKGEMKELRQQKQVVDARAEMITAVEQCCHRVDALEETVRSLSDSFEKYPDPEELSECVTWDALQSALLSERGSPLEELVSSEVVKVKPSPVSSNVSAELSHNDTHFSPQPVQITAPAASLSPSVCGQISDAHTATEAPEGHTGLLFLNTSTLQRHLETVEALRNISKLKETFSKLEARVAALEEGKVDESQPTQLRELMENTVSQDALDSLTDELNLQRAVTDGLMREQEKSAKLLTDVQRAIQQLQAKSEKLHEHSRNLHEDNRHTRSHIEQLHKTTEQLEEKKADKQMVESEIKADKCALENKVSRRQFDSVTEQLNAMFHELLSKVTGQEQNWHKVIDRLSAEMECKLNRIELDSVKKQLEGRWRNIHRKLQAQGAPEHDDAAALRKQLVDRFHCLSCDRPVVKYAPAPHSVKLPSSPGFPAHKSIRPFTVYALEQFRQHYRSERISALTNYSHLTVSRSCGGSHTVTSASQRRIGLQSMKLHGQTEADSVMLSEEVDIIGLDGHIYRGRLNATASRKTEMTETKLPTISTKDGLCKTTDKAKCSVSHKAAASPEVLPPHSAKSAQCSRSASSSSGRDWPVSALGCTSQSSFTQAAAESSTDQPVGL